MTTLNRSLLALLATVMFLLGGCSKTVEGEQESWATNVKQVSALQATYPGFEPALKARMAEAEAVHAEAEGLSGDAKIEKLSAANSALTRGYVGKLKRIDADMKALREKRVKAAAKASDASSRLGAKVAAEDAQKALDRTEAALKRGASDEASANAVVDRIVSDLSTATKAVDEVLKADRDKKDAKAEDAEAKDAKAAAAKVDADAKVAPWSCEFCGSENPHTAGKCESCGAPKGKAKAAAKDAKKP